jgi:hypothetical protein
MKLKNFIRKNKGVLLICIIFIILFIGLICLGLNVQKQQVLILHKQSLQILANEKAAQVNNFLESQKEKLEIIATMNVFKEAVLYPNDTAKIEIAKNRIDELKSIIPGIGVLTKEGIIILADIDLPGTDYSALLVFPMNNNSSIVFTKYYDPLRKKDYYAVGGPIYDRIEKNKVIGAIAFDIELDKISALMKRALESETNEVYLIDENGLLLSSSKYIGDGNKNGALIQEVKSEGAKECLEHLKKYGKNKSVEEHTEEVIQYTNYMGNEVFGAHAYIPSIIGCVIAEKSADEITKFSMIDYIKNILKIEKEVNDET